MASITSDSASDLIDLYIEWEELNIAYEKILEIQASEREKDPHSEYQDIREYFSGFKVYNEDVDENCHVGETIEKLIKNYEENSEKESFDSGWIESIVKNYTISAWHFITVIASPLKTAATPGSLRMLLAQADGLFIAVLSELSVRYLLVAQLSALMDS